MIKRYISLFELLCILAITSITGSLATKLFMEFIKHSQTLEHRQQNQRDLKNIVRSLRVWTVNSSEKIDEIDGLWFSGKNEIYLMDNKIVFKVNGETFENKNPKGYQLAISADITTSGHELIIVTAKGKSLKYSIKLKLGGES